MSFAVVNVSLFQTNKQKSFVSFIVEFFLAVFDGAVLQCAVLQNNNNNKSKHEIVMCTHEVAGVISF